MRTRRLSAEEHALWARVARTARPLPGKKPAEAGDPDGVPPAPSLPVVLAAPRTPHHHPRPVSVRSSPTPKDTLDGSWDKRLAKGDLAPDVTIDLHGETLATAHVRLNRGLEAALRRGDRTILLITGKPAVDNPRLPPTSRGVIRASVTDWLAVSSYADRIAAIRNAHPRHGGAGALYIILRRPR